MVTLISAANVCIAPSYDFFFIGICCGFCHANKENCPALRLLQLFFLLAAVTEIIEGCPPAVKRGRACGYKDL